METIVDKMSRPAEYVLIGGEQVEVKELTVKAAKSFARLVSGKAAKLVEVLSGGKVSTVTAIADIYDALEPELPAALSLLSGATISPEQAEKLTMREFAALLVSFAKVNDLAGFARDFSAVANEMKGALQKK